MTNRKKRIEFNKKIWRLIAPSVLALTVITGVALAGLPKEIKFVVDGQELTVTTSKKTIEEVLLEQGYDLERTRVNNGKLDDNISKKEGIDISTEKTIGFSNKGITLSVSTFSSDVSEFLKEQKIDVDEHDIITPGKSTKLTDKSTVKYDDVKKEKIVIEEDVEYKKTTKYDYNLAFGESETSQEGKIGKKEVTIERILLNGNVIDTNRASEKVIKEPVEEITLIGSKKVVNEEIDFEVEEKYTDNLYEGESEVVQYGIAGNKEYIYRVEGDKEELVSEAVTKEPVKKIVNIGTAERARNSSGSSTSGEYSLRDLQFHGIINWGGYKFTYYSQSVLPGGGLSIPGRHVNSDGYVADGDGYIVLASNPNIPRYSVINTPFGSQGKVYDRCASCTLNWYDVYTQ